MKKKGIFIFSILCILISIVLSCSDKIDVLDNVQPDIDDQFVELIAYHINDDYKVTEDEKFEDLEAFLFYKDESQNSNFTTAN